MRVEHIALWTPDLEKAKDFYTRYTEHNATSLAHFAVSAGNCERVDHLTERLRADGYRIAREPRVTGDGYYESVVLDPDGNRIEITI